MRISRLLGVLLGFILSILMQFLFPSKLNTTTALQRSIPPSLSLILLLGRSSATTHLTCPSPAAVHFLESLSLGDNRTSASAIVAVIALAITEAELEDFEKDTIKKRYWREGWR